MATNDSASKDELDLRERLEQAMEKASRDFRSQAKPIEIPERASELTIGTLFSYEEDELDQ